MELDEIQKQYMARYLDANGRLIVDENTPPELVEAYNTLNANDVNILEYKKPTIEILDDEPDLSSGYVGNVEPVASQSINNDDSVKIEEKDIDLSDLSDMFN